MMMRNRIFFGFAVLVFGLTFMFSSMVAVADQGMWLPGLMDKGLIKDMRSKGFRLTAEDLYSINRASIKDAVVLFDGGCTGEMISDQGLLLTNHHCGYDAIQAHSSVEHDYLTNGFVAGNRSEELANKGLKVRFLSYMKDVTDAATSGVVPGISSEDRDAVVAGNCRAIEAQAVADAGGAAAGYRAVIEPIYYGNQYCLFVYREYSDVRMVFAPPSSIGKFGGDTDNWMWPRHTGDFSIFRVYAAADGTPAEYSADNVPYRPARSLTISRGGVKDGDFTFVYGFPGRTQQYIHSRAVYHIVNQSNAERIAMRTMRLDVMNAAQAADAAVRIKYAAKNAIISNAWKKWQGESKGLLRLGTVAKKQELERQFDLWNADHDGGYGRYDGVVAELATLYDSLQPVSMAGDYYNEGIFGVEMLGLAARFVDVSDSVVQGVRGVRFIEGLEAFYKDYDAGVDRRTAQQLLAYVESRLDGAFLPEGFSVAALRAAVEGDSLFSGGALRSAFGADRGAGAGADSAVTAVLARVQSDSLFLMVRDLVRFYDRSIKPQVRDYNLRIAELYRPYMKGLMEMQRSERRFYPDANLTLRIAYGKVGGYSPNDAVDYRSVSTLRGVAEKDNPAIYDYDVPQRLREVIAARDYGDYGVASLGGDVPVAFIATNHTTGGNSGSPVLNARGELIGLNFDRVWEGTMSDIEFDEAVCRNIALDIRYVLFVVDRIGGAGYLLDEMRFSK